MEKETSREERSGPPVVAVATPPGSGAIAILRLSGAGSHQLVARFFRGSQPLEKLPLRQAGFGRMVDEAGRVLDEVLVIRYAAPGSYTGEDLVEINCHGGALLTANLLGLFLRNGAVAADPGEFTRRAFLNGKMDLTQAEAVMDLIQARTALALRAAAEQMEGRIGQEIRKTSEGLLDLLARLEAWIDFPEEEIDPQTGKELDGRIGLLLERIRQLLDTAEEGRILREGMRLAICGRPNAGKSSLLNRLLGFDRAIVSELPGTTRDTVEEAANLHGILFRMIDTAGLRESEDTIEKMGMQRTRDAMEKADILLEVIDSTKPVEPEFQNGERLSLLVYNKVDLAPPPGGELEGTLAVSCSTGEGMEALVQKLVELSGHREAAEAESFVAINARHQACLFRAADNLEGARSALAAGQELELVAIDLRAALEDLAEVTGKIDTEDILGKIFSTFCIGK